MSDKIITPYGFRVTVERIIRGAIVETHTFRAKTPARAQAMKAGEYKQGFVRLISVQPLTREEWFDE
jgi:hypothetical protein